MSSIISIECIKLPRPFRLQTDVWGDTPLIAPVQPSERATCQAAQMKDWLTIRPGQSSGRRDDCTLNPRCPSKLTGSRGVLLDIPVVLTGWALYTYLGLEGYAKMRFLKSKKCPTCKRSILDKIIALNWRADSWYWYWCVFDMQYFCFEPWNFTSNFRSIIKS